MANKWCLLKEYVDRFKRGLTSGEIDPDKLASMTSSARHTFLAKFVGEENAAQVNSLFESKLLLKNQKAGYISWAKKVGGMTAETRRDMISKIERLENVLNPVEEEAFLQDLASTKLGINITVEEAKRISELSGRAAELEKTIDKNGKFSSEERRLEYGANKVALENYVNELKLRSRAISFKDQPFKKMIDVFTSIPGIMKSTVASFDNSFWGRQGIKTLLDTRTSPIWFKDFLKSWPDMGKQILSKGSWWKSGDDAVMDSIKADIYSRPNALLGKYRIGKYGLDVLSEEAYPSSFPEKIPLFGRLFKASEVIYNGGALRLRADLADRLIKKAELNGVNTLNSDEAVALGHLIGSLTGRGSWGKGDVLAKEANVLLFSVKFLKANIDTLTVHLFDSKVRRSNFARKEAAKNLLSIILTVASVLTVAKLLNKESVEPDPHSANFGKIKIWGKWVDITGGMASLVVLASRLTPTLHEGKLSFWTKNSKGEYVDLLAGKYGQDTALDVFDQFWQGKLSPILGIVRDQWKGKDYQGRTPTIGTIAENQLPISIQNVDQFKSDPNSSFVLGSLILDALGFSVSSSVETNIKSKIIPEDKKISNEDFIQTVLVYAQAFGTDPETAFNRIFTGQKIRRVTNGTVIVERMPLKDSQDIKKKANADNPQMKLDHTIPLELGGSNDSKNLKLVTTSEWSSYTKVENALGKALKENKISKKEAQDEIVKFKKIQDTTARKNYGESLIKKYK
ncbi:MAG: hypothetical protein PHO75_02475 [Candidatus Shapirobacteria bacterium]|nr:hypothetical protein [Candidatus Shapirobacteria bacterium]